MACMYVDGQLLLQTLLYFTIAVTGLATAISSGLAKSHFGDQCILYGHATCASNATHTYCTVDYAGPSSICSFVTGSTIFICVFYALANGCYHAYAVHRSRVIIRVASQMWLRTLLFGTVLALLVTLVAACTLTVGLEKWCESVTATTTMVTTTSAVPAVTTTVTTTSVPMTTSTTIPSTSTLASTTAAPPIAPAGNNTDNTGSRRKREDGVPAAVPQTCSDSQKSNITWYFEEKVISVGEYVDFYEVAGSSCWVCVAFWFIQLFFYIYRLIKSRRQHQQNTYQDPFNTDDAFDVFT